MKHFICFLVMIAGLLPSVGKAEHIKQLALGYYTSCALIDSGKMKCWGYNGNGELGLGDNISRGSNSDMGSNLPYLNLSTKEKILSFSRGYFHACAVLESGRIKCWGYNGEGELGIESTGSRGYTSGQMGDLLAFTDLGTSQKIISMSSSFHNCAVFESGQVKCWGRNESGQLGLGVTVSLGGQAGSMGAKLPFVDLGTTEKVVSVSTGQSHSCAMLESGKVKCWGSNQFGQLGLGDIKNRGASATDMGANLPYVDLGTTEKVISMQLSFYSSYALFESGRVKAWGRNQAGELGLEDTRSRGIAAGEMGDKLPFIDFGTQTKVKTLKVGGNHACVVFEDNRMKCWGENPFGELGLGDNLSRGYLPKSMGTNLPYVPLDPLSVLDVSVGFSFTCAILKYLNVPLCFGGNEYGQLGLGTPLQNVGRMPGEVGPDSIFTNLGL